MIYSWKAYSEIIEEELNQYSVEGEPQNLYEPIDYTLKLGGKRIRPVLCLLAAQLFGGDQNKALKAAIGVEIFHNFTLVHDDIMDEAPLRRGKQTVHEKWNRDIAILSGDVMLVKAYDKIIESKAEKLVEILKLFNQTAVEVCEGQQLDMNFEKLDDVNIQEYIHMIKLKTSVLLACSLKIGALIADASDKEADLIYDFGKNLGIAFQIQDDYLDAYADPEKFGKRVGGDIILNKKTFLLLSAIEKSSKEQKERLLDLIQNSYSDEEKIEKMLSLYNDLNIPVHTQEVMNEYYNKAMQAIEKIDREEAYKEPLIDLANTLMQRVS